MSYGCEHLVQAGKFCEECAKRDQKFADSFPEQKFDGTIIPPRSIDVNPGKYGWNKLYHSNDMILVSRDEAESHFDAFVEGQAEAFAELENKIVSMAKAEESLDRRYTKLRNRLAKLCPEGVEIEEHLEAAIARAEIAEAILQREVSRAKADAFNYIALQLERAANLCEEEKDAQAHRMNAAWLRKKAQQSPNPVDKNEVAGGESAPVTAQDCNNEAQK